MLDQEYRKVKALLSEYSGAVHELAQDLMEHDEVDGQDVEAMVRRWDELIAEGKAPKALPEDAGVVVTPDADPQPYVFGGNGSAPTNGRSSPTDHSSEESDDR